MSWKRAEGAAVEGPRRKLDLRRIYLKKDGTRRIFLRRGKKWRPLVPKPIRSLMSPADMITLMNLLCGIMAIMYSIEGGPHFKMAIILILAGVIFDGVDGWAARKFGSSHRFGKWLDSFADAVTFCIAPAFLLYNLFHIERGDALERVQSLLAIVGSFSIALLGILRLARFSLSGYRFPDFIGLPTPAMAIIAVSFCGIYFWSEETGWMSGTLSSGSGLAIPSLLIIGSLAMVADIRYRRFRGRNMIMLGITTAAFITMTAVGFWAPEVGMLGAMIGAFASTGYLLSPIMAGPENVWGAAARMEKELEEEGLVPENVEEDGGMPD